MRPYRLIVGGLAIVCGLIAFGAVMQMAPKSGTGASAQTSPAAKTEDVLVTSRAMAPGERVAAADVRWQSMLSDSIPQGALRRAEVADAGARLVGASVRQALSKGDIITRARIASPDAGFMAAALHEGMRAVAIPIDARGGRSVGGFIFPQDRVDVLIARTDPSRGYRVEANAKTLLRGVRVMAIGQQLAETAGQKTIAGETATLEVTPAQAEELVAAMRVSEANLWLTLRPISDPADAGQREEAFAANRSITVVKFGTVRESQ